MQYLETDPLMTEDEAVELLCDLNLLTEQDLKELDLYLSSDETIPPDLDSKLQLILLAQVRPPTASLH